MIDRLRSGLLALLLVLGWSAQHVAAAQVPVAYGLPLYGRVASDVATFSDAEILSGFGNSRPKSAAGQLQRTLAKGGRFVRWGGPYIAGALLFNDALNWFYNQAQQSTALRNWWVGSGFPPMTSYSSSGNVYQPTGEVVCRGYNSSGLATVYHVGVYDAGTYKRYFGIFNQYSSTGVNVSGRGGSSAKDTYQQSKDLLLANECKTLTPEPLLSDIITSNPGAGREAADIMRRYLEAHPDKLKTVVTFPSSAPNINEESDDSVDCTIDTDSDGQNDCDELRRGPGVGGPGLDPQPGNRPGTDDGSATDPTDPNVKNPDTDSDGIPDWRDADDDNDGFPDDKETPEGQKDPNITPEPEEEPEPEEPKPCPSGYERTSPDGPCSPVKDPPKCPDGTKVEEGSDPPVCVPDDEPETPVPDECGDLSLKRMTTHTAHWLRDVVVPCEDLADLVKPIMEMLKTKFPFSVAAGLKDWFKVQGDPSTAQQMPDRLSVIPLEWGWLTGLWSLVKTVVGVALYAWLGFWLVDRFAPRTSI